MLAVEKSNVPTVWERASNNKNCIKGECKKLLADIIQCSHVFKKPKCKVGLLDGVVGNVQARLSDINNAEIKNLFYFFSINDLNWWNEYRIKQILSIIGLWNIVSIKEYCIHDQSIKISNVRHSFILLYKLCLIFNMLNYAASLEQS